MLTLLLNSLFPLLTNCFFVMSYVTNISSFKSPLSAEEERKYLELCKAGDKNAKNILIERNLRLVAHVVKKYPSSRDDNEDLISIGTIGLIKAINTFKQEKSNKLATYVARCIENEILMLMRANKKIQGDISLNDPIGVDKEGNQILLMDIIGTDDDEFVWEIDNKDQIKKLYSNIEQYLDERET